MKYLTHLNSNLRFAAVALGVLIVFGPASTRAGHREAAAELGKTQQLAFAETVPDGLTAFDWSSICAAYQAHRHQVLRVEGGGYRAHNPEQQWRTEFDGRGFTTRSQAGDWQWGLELRSYGFSDQKRSIGNAVEVTAQGARVTYLYQRGCESGL
jgi:hypothetical protein